MTIATEFQREVFAHLMLVAGCYDMPEILSVDSLRRRYIVAAVEVFEDEDGRPEGLTFYDGSSAQRDTEDRRIWREITDA